MPDDALSGNLSDMAGMFGQAQDQAETQPWKIKTETDGTGEPTTTITAPHKDILAIQQKMGYLEQALASMSSEAARLKQREEETRRHPLMNVLAQVAGNLAAGDKRLPPIVAALGRTSLALNPAPDQLAHQRIGLEGQIARTAGEGAQVGMGLLRENRLERRMEQEAVERKKADNAKIYRDLSSDAQKGLLSDATVTAKVLQDTGVEKGVAENQAAQLVAISTAKRELDAAAQQAKDAREAATLKERAREADNHMATILQAGQLHAETQMKLMAMKEEETARKASAKTDEQRKKLPATLPDKLANLTAAEKSLDEVEAGLKKYSKYQGVLAGRTLEPVGAYMNTDVAKFFNKMRIQVAQVIKSTGAGARGFGPMERSYFEKLAESKNHSPAENLGVIESWRDYLRQNRSAYLETYEGLRDPKWKRAFGKDAETLFTDIPDESGGDPVEEILKKYAKPK